MTSVLLTNRNGRGDFIRHKLQTETEQDEPVYIASAFFTDHELLRDVSRKSKRVRLIVRLGFPTSPAALQQALQDKAVDVRYFTDATFHPKLYIFGSRRAFVGSANLTSAAVISNQEILVSVDADDPRFLELSTLFSEYWDQASVLDSTGLEKYRRLYEAHRRISEHLEALDVAVVEALGSVQFANIDRGKVFKSKENIFVEGFRKTYQETVSAFNLVRDAYVAHGKRKVAENRLPLRLEIDSFFSFVRDRIATGDSWADPPLGWSDERRRDFKRALDMWHDTPWPHLESTIVYENYPRLVKVFRDAGTIRSSSDEDLFNALLTLHSFYECLRFHSGGLPGLRKAFINGNGAERIREGLVYLVHGEDDLIQRMANMLYQSDWKLNAFGQSNVQELVGWQNREDLPVINGRTTKILRYFGFDVRQI